MMRKTDGRTDRQTDELVHACVQSVRENTDHLIACVTDQQRERQIDRQTDRSIGIYMHAGSQ